MAEFNREAAQSFQDGIIIRVRDMERMLDREVLQYYKSDQVDNYADYKENLQGMHNYLKRAYAEIDKLLTDIEWRQNNS